MNFARDFVLSPLMFRRCRSVIIGIILFVRAVIFIALYLVPTVVHNNLVNFSDLQFKVKLFKPCGFLREFLRVFKRLSLVCESRLQIRVGALGSFLKVGDFLLNPAAEQIFKAGRISNIAR